MSQQNSVSPFTKASTKDLLEAIGITQFINETNWYQVIGGLIIQGGTVTTHSSGSTVPFNASFTKQVLNVIVQPINAAPTNFYVDNITLDTFDISHGGGGTHDYHWFAIGV